MATNNDRPTLGLVLSGGAVRGAAHLGVLAVLDEAGIRPDLVVGTSVGSAVGALYAAGQRPEALLDLLEPVSWRSLVELSLTSGRSLFGTAGFERYLRERLERRSFEELALPFRAVACDLLSGEAVALGEGDVVEAVLASCALPGLFPPVERDGRLLVDGGVVDNLPLEVAFTMGADYCIGVDLLPPFRPDGPAPGNFFEVWERSLYLMIRGGHPAPGERECRIQPDISGCSFTDFDEVGELYRRGAAAAREALPRLRTDLDSRSA